MMNHKNKRSIAITGHTKGLGKGLFDHFIGENYHVLGFSRSNDYDLFESKTCEEITRKIEDCDIFINCAFANWSQVDLLFSVFEAWKDRPKHIINISSNSGDGIKNYIHPYAIQKSALDKACEQLNHIPQTKCRVTNLRPAWIATERIKHLKIDEPQLKVSDVVRIVEWILNLPVNVHISNLSVRALD